MYTKVLWSTAGSAVDDKALLYAARLTRPHGVLHVVYVAPPADERSAAGAPAEDDDFHSLRCLVVHLESLGVQIRMHCLAGPREQWPRIAAEIATSVRPDVIVAGSQPGAGELAEQMHRRSRCPVAIVPGRIRSRRTQLSTNRRRP